MYVSWRVSVRGWGICLVNRKVPGGGSCLIWNLSGGKLSPWNLSFLDACLPGNLSGGKLSAWEFVHRVTCPGGSCPGGGSCQGGTCLLAPWHTNNLENKLVLDFVILLPSLILLISKSDGIRPEAYWPHGQVTSSHHWEDKYCKLSNNDFSN